VLKPKVQRGTVITVIRNSRIVVIKDTRMITITKGKISITKVKVNIIKDRTKGSTKDKILITKVRVNAIKARIKVKNQYNQGQNQGQNQYNQGQNQGQNQYSQGQNQSNQGNYQPPYNSGSSQPVKYNPSAGMNPPAGSNNTTSNTSSQNCNQSSGGSLSVGAIVALKNNNTGRFLSSQPIRYQGGSGQQQVTANQWSVSDCDKWQLVSGFNQPNASNGSLINFNQIIRLRHQGTGCYLHSHPNINSPLSQYQEVSGYGDGNNSDDNDNWVLEKFTYNSGQENGAADFGSAFKLRHCKTGMYLYSHERTMQVNGAAHAEVACYGNGNDESNKWRFQLA